MEMPTQSTPTESNGEPPIEEEHHKTHSLIANLIVLIVLIALGLSGVYAYKTFIKPSPEQTASPATQEEEKEEIAQTDEQDVEPTSEETEASEDEPAPTDEKLAKQEMEARNNQRLADLTSIEKALIETYEVSHQYPKVDEIKTILETWPTPPNEDEVYFYAVYDNDLGIAQVYILSAKFENEDGTTEVWATGGNILEFTDFNDVSQENVTVLHPSITEEEYLSNQNTTPENSDEEDDSEKPKERVPRV
jgi:hypothetical protein